MRAAGPSCDMLRIRSLDFDFFLNFTNTVSFADFKCLVLITVTKQNNLLPVMLGSEGTASSRSSHLWLIEMVVCLHSALVIQLSISWLHTT